MAGYYTLSFGLQSFPILFKRLHFFMGGTFSRSKFTQVSVIITTFFNSIATRQGHSVPFRTWRLLPLKRDSEVFFCFGVSL